MKTKELIKLLENMNPNSEVVSLVKKEMRPLAKVSYDKKANKVRLELSEIRIQQWAGLSEEDKIKELNNLQ